MRCPHGVPAGWIQVNHLSPSRSSAPPVVVGAFTTVRNVLTVNMDCSLEKQRRSLSSSTTRTFSIEATSIDWRTCDVTEAQPHLP